MRAPQRLAAYALIIDEAGRVLLTRQMNKGHLGRWILPGGGVELGEHPEQAAIREVREETGLPVRVGELRAVLSDFSTVGRRRRILHNVRLIYQATVVPADPDAPTHRLCDYAHWFTQPAGRALELASFTARVLDSEPWPAEQDDGP